jgi:hypothetical protein
MNVAGGGGSSFLRGSGVTLTNVDNTIQGAGSIGDLGALGFVNKAAGTLFANGGSLNVGAAGGSFLNNGTVKVAAGATLSVTGDASGYVQNQVGGTTPITKVDGSLIAPRGMNILAGLLEGTGSITGNVISSGMVHPGDSPGILTIIGDYTQTASGIFDITLAGLTAGTDYSQLDVTGSATLNGTFDVTLSQAFNNIAVGEAFAIMLFANSSGDFSSFELNGSSCSSGGTDLWNCANGFEFGEKFVAGNRLDLVVDSVGPNATPLPPSWTMLLAGLAFFGFMAFRQKQGATISAA